MATDRDEQQRQQQELEEIRRSFAEMGARMGSLFEPAETDEHHGGTPPPVLPPAPPVERRRPSWQLLAGAVVLLLVGTAFGWALSPGGSDSPTPAAAPTTQVVSTTTAKPLPPRTEVSVPEQCVETAELADEVISRLTRNIRDERLFLALRDYTIASQACRREASP
jgi:alkanesulfonate monooxygenase SsuD/methylene tetrahydromethanopterin reductase-like flavin-dependent oxidoreductase (luciferase family)